MIKRIDVQQLRPGMFVHDLDRDWMDHPFLTDSFMVHSEKDIEKMIEHGISALYIDPLKGLDVVDAPTRHEVAQELERDVRTVVEATESTAPTSMREEMTRAREVLASANQAILAMMQGVRHGHQVELRKLDPIVHQMSASILRNQHALLSLCRIKEKDNYTFMHSISVGAMLMSFARTFDVGLEEIQQIGIGGMLHDIGKIRIPDRLLNKPGALTPDEVATMQMHVVHGQTLLSEARDLSQTSFDVVAQHHERYDGTGYPLKLKGHQLSVPGRMASIVDVYDAITSDRCYRPAMDTAVAIRKMFEWSRTHFDPELVRVFVRTIGIYPIGTLVMLESRKIGVVVDQDNRDLTRPVVRAVFDAGRMCQLTPHDIDLSKPLGQGGGDRIVRHEAANAWRINPQQYL